MKKDDAIVSDIERNKELFEYEMTDVLIKLKGEFAVVNGKELQGDALGMTVEDVRFELTKPDITVEKPTVGAPDIPEISEPSQISIGTVVKPSVTIPDTKTAMDIPKIESRNELPAQLLKQLAKQLDMKTADIGKLVPADKKKLRETPEQMLKRFEQDFDIKLIDTERFKNIPKHGVDRDSMPKPVLGKLSVTTTAASDRPMLDMSDLTNFHIDIDMNEITVPAVKKMSNMQMITVNRVSSEITVPKVQSANVKVQHDRIIGTNIPAKTVHGFGKNVNVNINICVDVPDTTMPVPDIESFKTAAAELPEMPAVPEKPDLTEYIDDILNSFKV